jgi:serine/threonine-protein kinase
LNQVVASALVPPRRIHSAIPRHLETICLKCLAKEPSERYASALELADDLARAQHDEPITARRRSKGARGWRAWWPFGEK